jgi:hypothetical protein
MDPLAMSCVIAFSKEAWAAIGPVVMARGRLYAEKKLGTTAIELAHIIHSGDKILHVYEKLAPPAESPKPITGKQRWLQRVLAPLFAPIYRRLDAMTDQEAALNVAINDVKTAVAGVKTRIETVIEGLKNKPTTEVPDLTDEIAALSGVASDLNAFTPVPDVAPAPVPAPGPVPEPLPEPTPDPVPAPSGENVVA